MHLRPVVLGLGLAATLAACAPKVNIQEERAALLRADSAWAAAATAGDIQKLGTFWSEDAVNYFPGAPVASGRDAILGLVARNRSIPGFSVKWEATTARVSESGDLGYTTGPFQVTATTPDGTSVTRSGHYVAIWRKNAAGAWECVVESSIFGPAPGATQGG
jgi:ketosteroid isomerase-like protein